MPTSAAPSPPAESAGSSGTIASVEQSLAIAVQDATDFLRATMTLAIGALGAGTAQYLATGDARFLAAMDASQRSIDLATKTLSTTLDLVNRRPGGTKA